MGEGAALFVLKRLADAERAGDRIYAVLLGIAGSSDGKGKGITAPNPAGQRLAIERAWRQAGVSPATATMVEAHGTSTRVGDAAELESLTGVFGPAGAAPGSVALGSVKSNIGHLKAAAGTAGLFKLTMSLHEKVLPPSLNFRDPNPNVDWASSPFRVNTELREWAAPTDGPRRGAVSAFGFGGTNFHAVLEEYVPGRHAAAGRSVAAATAGRPQVTAPAGTAGTARPAPSATREVPAPSPRGAVVLGAASDAELAAQLRRVQADAAAGIIPPRSAPDPALAGEAVRVAIDYGDAAELAGKADKAAMALSTGNAALFRMLRSQGVFVGRGPAPKVAFLYTGQGSQYVNMLKDLRAREPIVARAFDDADRIMTPLLGRPLTSYIFIDGSDPKAVATLEQQLLQTEITQPAVLATDLALTRLLDAHGVVPDMVMGHSLGEYGALVAAGALDFDAALEAVSARGHEMASLTVADNGAMAAVFGPLAEIERIVAEADGYVVVANVNSTSQAVVGGATDAVERIVQRFQDAGMTAQRIPVSHAFHTSIVAPATEPLKVALRRLDLRAPRLPIVANVTGEFYPADADVDTMLDILGRQVASPVQFVRGLHTLYDAGARVFVEVGPKKALHGFVEDVLGATHDDVLALFTNHPKLGDEVSFNQALCGLYAAGHGLAGTPAPEQAAPAPAVLAAAPRTAAPAAAAPMAAAPMAAAPAVAAPAAAAASPGTAVGGGAVPGTISNTVSSRTRSTMNPDTYTELGRLFADFLERGRAVYEGGAQPGPAAVDRTPVVVTGAALGLPGVPRVFDDENIARILDGQQFIETIPHQLRQAMVDRHITRLVKPENGDPMFVTIDNEADVVKLAGRHGPFDLVAEFGVEDSRDAALDNATRFAFGAGIDALRDAGLPLVMRYRTTTLGTQLRDRWGLPDELRDDTGVIFASAFPGYGSFATDLRRYLTDRGRRHELAALQAVRARMRGDEPAFAEVDRRVGELEHLLATEPFAFDRRFLFRVLSMGHSQFAELIGARGPNTQINAACASTTQAMCLAEDWIRAGRCRRVVVISADDVTDDELLPWVVSGFLATGAAATDDIVEEAAVPFDRRRHGMIVGMGAAAVVVESAEAARERGVRPICEMLAGVTANSAYHGTRLDIDHVSAVMERTVRQAEARGLDRQALARELVFVSHETYTPARGGSASAEINALRAAFGAAADDIVISNTKGFTGHAMGAGIEDVVAIKALETGIVPPVPNFKEVDPDLGRLNLSIGGAYPVEYALRLAAGFGSQLAMTVLHRIPSPTGRRPRPDELGFRYRIEDETRWQSWLARVTRSEDPELEVVQHRLRVVDRGPVAAGAPVASTVASTVVAPVGPAPTARMAPAPVVPAAVVPAAVVPAAVVPAAVAPAPVAPAPAAALPTAEPAADPVAEAVVSIVAGLTGYPAELLDLDLDLEADLGVDTVKQAEVFAAVRSRFGIERDESVRLRDFPTLRHVLDWVRPKLAPESPAPAAAAPAAPAAPVAAAAAAPAADPVVEAVVSIVAGLTGYPAELLDLDLDLEADLGVDTVKQAEVFAAVRSRFGIERDESVRLRDFPTLRHVLDWVRPKLAPESPAPAAESPAAAAAAPVAAAPVAAAAAAPAADPVVEAVVSIVAGLTGYPAELLDLDLDLEADLGVDTVKQAEVFAAVRSRFGIERDESVRLRDFPTLRHVLDWVRPKLAPEFPAPAAESPAAAAESPAAESPAAPVAAAPVAAAAAAPAADPVVEAVVSIVAGLTGYPAELLDLDLDLEADLGVDTVKQAEVFAAVRSRFGIERDESVRLRDFPTLRHVLDWVRPKLAPADQPAEQAAAEQPTERSAEQVGGQATASGPAAVPADARFPRRVPVPVLRPVLDLCTPSGVELGAGSRVIVMLDEGGAGTELVRRLRDREVDTLVLESGVSTNSLTATLGKWVAAGRIDGVYWLAALDDEGPLGELDLPGWREALRRRVKSLYATVRAAYDSAPFLVVGTRLGGYLGYDEAGATAPLGGAASGFAKAYKRERTESLVKVVDVPSATDAAAVAGLLLEETLRDAACTEVGHPGDGTRWSVGLGEQPVADGSAGMALGADTVFVVTGAAGSIVSAITADLAAASGGVFHLLDLTPEPDAADPDLRRFVSDKDGLKADIAARMKAKGKRPTPVLIEKELAGYERLAAALAAIEAITAAGGTAHYHSVDLTDAAAVDAALSGIAAASGRIDVLLHAAGLEISRTLPDKKPKEFDLVFDVKSDGWFTVLRAAGELPIGATVAFSSVAGRFGNAGQTDYSAANDLLCKITSSFRRTRPDTRGIVIDWTAWGGIGMATRGSIPKIMEMAGIGMLDPAVGVPWIRGELTGGRRRGEVVVAGTLGVLAAEPDPSGGLDRAALDAAGPMVGEVSSRVYDGLVVSTTLDPTQQLFLDHHRIDGTAVLPGVMGIEAFAEAARLLVPDRQVEAIEDVDFRAPVKFYRDEPRVLTVRARFRRDAADPDALLADCRLEAERQLPGQSAPERTVHFTGTVRLGRGERPAEHAGTVDEPEQVVAAERVYQLYFHGPAYQVVDAYWPADGGGVARWRNGLPAAFTPDAPTQADPRLIELVFQTAGLREAADHGRLALPLHVDRVRLLAGSADGARWAVTHEGDGGVDATVRDGSGAVVLAVHGYRTVALPGELTDEVRAGLVPGVVEPAS